METDFRDEEFCYAFHQNKWWRIERQNPYRLYVIKKDQWVLSIEVENSELHKKQVTKKGTTMLEDKIDLLIVEQQTTNDILRGLIQQTKGTTAGEEKVKKETAAAKKKREAAEKKAKDEADAKTEEDDFGLGEEAEPETSSEPQMTLDDVEDELRIMIKNKKGPQARELLTKFKVKKISELEDEQINAFYAEVKAANSGE